MMFESAFNLTEEAELIRHAVEQSIAKGIVSEDISEKGKAYSTSEVGDWICDFIEKSA